MASANVRWVSGKQFVGTDLTKHSVVLSTPDEGVGMKPSDMLLVGLAGCTAVDVVEILAKKRTPLSSLEIQTTAVQDEDAPWTFRKFHMKYIVKGKGLTQNLWSRPLRFRKKSIVRWQQRCAAWRKSPRNLRSCPRINFFPNTD